MIDADDHGTPSADEQGGPDASSPRRQFQRNRLRLGVAIAVVCGALAFLVIQGLGEATTFFRNADEAVAQRDELGTSRFRLQGTVVPGSVQEVGSVADPAVLFEVEFHCERVAVRHTGSRPELFQNGIPVVLEGAFGETGDTYESDRIFVRHTEEYTAEEADRLEKAAEEGCET
ncbi:MAG TPA: cytochrome c maturation protein CcmE [Acidimicrobiales bacterium]|nr:cytochrome c maturation protein CcmE [Acidimicrobiales bacterium]